jgi:hypothetical protein
MKRPAPRLDVRALHQIRWSQGAPKKNWMRPLKYSNTGPHPCHWGLFQKYRMSLGAHCRVRTHRSHAVSRRHHSGRQRLMRHGHLPERKIVTGIGKVAVRCPRVRDRAGEGADPLLVCDLVAVRAPLEEPRGADSDPLSRGRFHRRLRGGSRPRPSGGSRMPGRRSPGYKQGRQGRRWFPQFDVDRIGRTMTRVT